MFGFLKRIFGGGGKAVEKVTDIGEQAIETAQEAVSNTVEQAKEMSEAVPASVVAAIKSLGEAAHPSEPVQYIDRDEFDLPRSPLVVKALDVIEQKAGGQAVARGLRVFEYSMASALAFDLRVDRELLALSALFGESGADAATAAKSFCVAEGMWEALAEKVHDAIAARDTGANSDILETRAIALGVMAEAAKGNVPYINGATVAETLKRHAA